MCLIWGRPHVIARLWHPASSCWWSLYIASPLVADTVCPPPSCRVDNGIPLAAALQQHHAWLCEHGFVGPNQRPVAVTWTDWDLKVHRASLPACTERTAMQRFLGLGSLLMAIGYVRHAGPYWHRPLRHQM